MTPEKSIQTSVTCPLRPGTKSWTVSSVSAVSNPPKMGHETCRSRCRVYTRRQSMSRNPSSIYSQK